MGHLINKERETQIIVRIRALAVLLIVTAHCILIPLNASTFSVQLKDFCASVSSFGVWIFFLLGGYLLAYEKKPILAVMKRKVVSIILPWFFTGALVYLYTAVRHGGISLGAMLKFVLGYGSYLWYMSVFVLLMLLFLMFRQVRLFPATAIAAGVLLEMSGILYSLVGSHYESYYFLVSWIVPFGGGYAINAFGLQDRLYRSIRKYGGVFALLAVLSILAVFSKVGRWYYWSRCYFPLAVVVTPGILSLVLALEKRLGKCMDAIGSASYSIYLCHMPVAGAVAAILSRIDRGYTVPFRAAIVVAITYGAIRFTVFLAKKAGIEKTVKTLLGLR